MTEYKIGQTVQYKDGQQGVIRYIGGLHIAAGDWLGLELPERTGKNDGSVQGRRYFSCEQGHGMFIRQESGAQIVKQPAPAARTNGTTIANGGAVKPRQSTVGVTPDAARKRQSMMSTGSSAPGSRMSVRVSQRSAACEYLLTVAYSPLRSLQRKL